jgi:hypothetical protein
LQEEPGRKANMERRVAEVTAVDCWDNPNFRFPHKQLNSNVTNCGRDVYELTPREMGYFDIVLFFGVLYHLKHPFDCSRASVRAIAGHRMFGVLRTRRQSERIA